MNRKTLIRIIIFCAIGFLASLYAAVVSADVLEDVNNYYNQATYKEEVGDVWLIITDPTGEKATYDCEDFAISKYFALRKLGYSIDRLRIAYVKAIDYNKAHMVALVFKDGEWYVLDNLTHWVEPLGDRDDLHFVYSFNEEGLWLSKARGKSKRVGDANRIPKWDDLLARIQNHSGELYESTR